MADEKHEREALRLAVIRASKMAELARQAVLSAQDANDDVERAMVALADASERRRASIDVSA